MVDEKLTKNFPIACYAVVVLRVGDFAKQELFQVPVLDTNTLFRFYVFTGTMRLLS